MPVVMLQFDRLPASSLGCYGSFACQTPAFDLLAAQGITFDLCFVSDPARSLRPVRSARWPLLELSLDARSRPAIDRSALQLQERIGCVEEMPIWCAVRLGAAAEIGPEELVWEGEDDLDDRLHRHFDSVALADTLLMRCLEVIAQYSESVGVVLAAERGDPLAARVARPGGILPVGEELAHVPFIVALSDESPNRCSELVGTAAVAEFLTELIGLDPPQARTCLERWQAGLAGTTHLAYATDSWQAARTREWLAVRETRRQRATDLDQADDESAIQLYAKPDDRWELLDLAAQYPLVVAELAAAAGWELEANL